MKGINMKQYIKPEIFVESMELQSMLAASTPTNSYDEVGNGVQLTRQRGWGNSWNDEEEDF
jgi:hypothetical protein